MKTDNGLMSSTVPDEGASIMLRFISFLRRHRVHTTLNLGYLPGVHFLCVALDIDKRAAAEGRKNLPSPSEVTISGSQKDIVEYHRKLQASARSKVKKLAARLDAAARQVDPSETINRLRDIPSKCQHRIDRILAELESKDTPVRQQDGSAQQSGDSDAQRKAAESQGNASKAVFFMMMLAVGAIVVLALGSDLVLGGNSGPLLDLGSAFVIACMTMVLPYLVAVRVSAPYLRMLRLSSLHISLLQ